MLNRTQIDPVTERLHMGVCGVVDLDYAINQYRASRSDVFSSKRSRLATDVTAAVRIGESFRSSRSEKMDFHFEALLP
jgi:hypothetical protein